jgi:protein gp37
MSEGSPIGWLHKPGTIPMTGNVVLGCRPRSEGCLLCFAPRSVVRQAHLPGRGDIVTHNDDGRLEWTGIVKMFPERVAALRTKTKPHTIFVTALGELFDPQVTMEFLIELWQAMADTPQHTYIILTKLAGRMYRIVSQLAEQFGVLPNVWLGVSAENQDQANKRIYWLMKTPAAIRVVSCEPMLGPIDLTRIPARSRQQPDMVWDVLNKRHGVPGQWQAPLTHGLDWVIVGGESGRKDEARPMHPLRDGGAPTTSSPRRRRPPRRSARRTRCRCGPTSTTCCPPRPATSAGRWNGTNFRPTARTRRCASTPAPAPGTSWTAGPGSSGPTATAASSTATAASSTSAATSPNENW